MSSSTASSLYRTPIVLENGSSTIKLGMANETQPRQIIPPLLANNLDQTEKFYGHEAKNKNVVIKRLIDEEVTDWEEIENLWEYCFKNYLNLNISEHPILMTNIEFNSRQEKEKIGEILFEKIKVPTLFLAEQSLLSLYGAGKLTGTVLWSGFKKSEAVPIYEGLIIEPSIPRTLYLGGAHITSALLDSINRAGNNCDLETANEIKEKLFYVSPDPTQELVKTQTYKLPDGKCLQISKESYLIPETLFNPKCHWYGLHQMAFNAVKKCDAELQNELFSNIILAGGNTLLPGLRERLNKEIAALGRDVEVAAPDDRLTLAWKGGAAVASLPTFRQMWVSRGEYKEYGANVIARKCF